MISGNTSINSVYLFVIFVDLNVVSFPHLRLKLERRKRFYMVFVNNFAAHLFLPSNCSKKEIHLTLATGEKKSLKKIAEEKTVKTKIFLLNLYAVNRRQA